MAEAFSCGQLLWVDQNREQRDPVLLSTEEEQKAAHAAPGHEQGLKLLVRRGFWTSLSDPVPTTGASAPTQQYRAAAVRTETKAGYSAEAKPEWKEPHGMG